MGFSSLSMIQPAQEQAISSGNSKRAVSPWQERYTRIVSACGLREILQPTVYLNSLLLSVHRWIFTGRDIPRHRWFGE